MYVDFPFPSFMMNSPMVPSWPDSATGGALHNYRGGQGSNPFYSRIFRASLRLNIGFKTTAITSTLKIDSSTDNTNNNASLCTFGLGLNRLRLWYFEYFEVPFKKSHSKMGFIFRLSTSTKQMPHLYERMWLNFTTGGISSHKSH